MARTAVSGQTIPGAPSLTPLNFEIDISGVTGTQMIVNAMEKRAIDPAPYLRSVEVKRQLEGSATRRMERGPFKPVSREWQSRKRREGLSPKTMHASERLAHALEHTTSDVRLDTRRTTLVWGIQQNSDLWMRTHIQATRGRHAVVIDASAQKNIALGIASYIVSGSLRRAAVAAIAPGPPIPP